MFKSPSSCSSLNITKLEVEEALNLETRVKFGEIYLENDTNLVLVCEYCSVNLLSLELFQNHISEHFQSHPNQNLTEFDDNSTNHYRTFKRDEMDLSNEEDNDYGNDNDIITWETSPSPSAIDLIGSSINGELELISNSDKEQDLSDIDMKSEIDFLTTPFESQKSTYDNKIPSTKTSQKYKKSEKQRNIQRENLFKDDMIDDDDEKYSDSYSNIQGENLFKDDMVDDDDKDTDSYSEEDLKAELEFLTTPLGLIISESTLKDHNEKELNIEETVVEELVVEDTNINDDEIVQINTSETYTKDNSKSIVIDSSTKSMSCTRAEQDTLIKLLQQNCSSNLTYCPICEKPFRYRYGLFRHVAIKHIESHTTDQILQIFKDIDEKINEEPPINIINNKMKLDNPQSEASFECTICQKKYFHESSFIKHTKRHARIPTKKYECQFPNCNEKYTTSYLLKNHLNLHTGETFECNFCSKKFINDERLRSHIRIHIDNKLWQCDHCEQKYLTKSELFRHIRGKHTKEIICQCELCGRGFTTLSEMTHHKRRHTNTRNFVCETCKKRFYSRFDLKRHQVIHTKEKPYKCSVCMAQFSMQGALWTHNRLHSGERRYKCKVCDKSFVQSAGLHCHMKSHNKCNSSA